MISLILVLTAHCPSALYTITVISNCWTSDEQNYLLICFTPYACFLSIVQPFPIAIALPLIKLTIGWHKHYSCSSNLIWTSGALDAAEIRQSHHIAQISTRTKSWSLPIHKFLVMYAWDGAINSHLGYIGLPNKLYTRFALAVNHHLCYVGFRFILLTHCRIGKAPLECSLR